MNTTAHFDQEVRFFCMGMNPKTISVFLAFSGVILSHPPSILNKHALKRYNAKEVGPRCLASHVAPAKMVKPLIRIVLMTVESWWCYRGINM